MGVGCMPKSNDGSGSRGSSVPVLSVGRPGHSGLADARKLLTDQQLVFAAWLAEPEGLRVPATRVGLASQLNVSTMTLRRWELRSDVQLAVRWLVLNASGDPLRLSRVLDEMYKMIWEVDDGSRLKLDYMRAWLQAVGATEALKRESRLLEAETVEELDLSRLSRDELVDMREALLAVQRSSLDRVDDGDDGDVVDADVVDGVDDVD